MEKEIGKITNMVDVTEQPQIRGKVQACGDEGLLAIRGRKQGSLTYPYVCIEDHVRAWGYAIDPSSTTQKYNND
jgi:hypothetical protein